MRKILIVFIAFAFVNQSFAQDNVFLKREFWDSKPTVETIDLKIKEGNDIAEANSNNFDGVVYAILQNAPNATIQYAISKEDNDVNKLTHDGRTYIFWAAYKGNVELMQFLLDKGAKTDLTDDKGNTILNFAAGSGQSDTKVYDLMLERGANLQKDLTPSGANALLLAAPYDKDFSLINYFTSKGLDINSVDSKGNGVFNYVARTGNIDLMNQLLKKGVKGNDNAFIFAAQGTRGTTNGLEVYSYLESVGLNPKAVAKDGETPLHILASRSKDLEVINYFLKKGVDVNQADADGNTPFLNAASRNTLEIVTLLSKNVKDINHQNKKGQSALSLAVANNSSEVVDFLLKNKADIKIVDAEGNDLTAYLMESFSTKQESVFKQKLDLLQNKGFKFGKTQADGDTLYHLALDKNDLFAIKFVEQFKVDVNAKNKEGLTPLHKAAMTAKDSEILEYLISIGAKKDLVTDFDETAYDLASENEILKQKNTSIEFLK
ncbi:ankyrin repeat domain-containing protein [Subsaxibacter sp. CAU 1640]|uniref:ankyrin repeat domain-containing protein n=1 Tax=Subsaxibacter sp. CAU 1640 TaxID=2933271 RepID=UPI0020033221|nr:ankyrin repeat domain-containing protein [Subsaxibacter sp. CAU 1640]MCK7589320.1 ankyrin repeat domain-containing protein [Subsaxibacter sp. CAU 1640]